jgi:hypothetical protein
MPKAALVQALMVNDEIIVPAGEMLTGLQAHHLWLRYRQDMEFQCLHCRLPLTAVNIHQERWKRRPHFRPHPNKKEEHTSPCVYAGASEPGVTPTGEVEVTYDKLEAPTELIKRMPRPAGTTIAMSGPYRRAEDDSTPERRHEEHTCYTVEELCDVYFEKTEDCQSREDYRRELQRWPLSWPGSKRDMDYAKAFRNVNWRFLGTHSYIFYGAAKEVVRCRDGYVISYRIPGQYHNAWRPVAAYLPWNVLDQFDWGRHVKRILEWDEINKTPWVFLCGRPRQHGQGIVIPLESVYWIHCTRHPRWHNRRVQVSTVLQRYEEVLQSLFARRHTEFQQRFSLEGRVHGGGIDHAAVLPQPEQLISHPDVSPPLSFTEIVNPPALPQESPEQSSTSLDKPDNTPLPEQASAHNGIRQLWMKKLIARITRRWKRR